LTRRAVAEPAAAYRALAIESTDAPAAALRRFYRRSRGCDGLVEIACPPDLTKLASGMVAFGEHAARRPAAPNLLVPVPSTPRGRIALQELTYRGLKVASSDVLSGARAEAVAAAHMRGLERRVADGLRIDGLVSIAWVPIAELDAVLDAQLPAGSP